MASQSDSLILRPEQALFELTLLNAEAAGDEFDEVVIPLLNRGIPPEILTRLLQLWEHSKIVAGEIVAVGKIIVRSIVDFLLANPKLAIGLAIGAALASLIAAIPLLGPVLQPFATWISMGYAGGVGASMQNGDYSGSPLTAAIILAEKFFQLLITIFNGVQAYWIS